jgi:hypothetical protein
MSPTRKALFIGIWSRPTFGDPPWPGKGFGRWAGETSPYPPEHDCKEQLKEKAHLRLPSWGERQMPLVTIVTLPRL